jgi:hypothetical protein
MATVRVSFLLGGERFLGRLNRYSVLSDVPAKATRVNPCMNAVARFWRDDRRTIRSKRRRSAPTDDRNSLKRKSRWPSRGHDVPLFASGWHLRARNGNRASRHWLLQKPRSNGIACRAAAERRTTRSWDGCGHATDDPEARGHREAAQTYLGRCPGKLSHSGKQYL